MSANRFTDEFKRDAVAQVEDRGYLVREVAERSGVSTNSTYTWQKQFSRPAKVIQQVDAGPAARDGGVSVMVKFIFRSIFYRLAAEHLPTQAACALRL